MGQTIIEKILARAAGRSQVQKGEIVFCTPHRILSHDNSAAISKIFKQIHAPAVWDPERIFIALDHAVPPPDERKALNHKIIREFVQEHNIKHFYDCGTGICHQVLPENGHVLPGTIIFGSDSHTTTHGAFGAAGIPIGRTETASVWAIGKTWLKVPETLKFVLTGNLKQGVYAKDVILFLIGQIGASATRNWLDNCVLHVHEDYEPLSADNDAEYKEIYDFNLEELDPQVACPHKVDNVFPVKNLLHTKIDVAFLGTCTNGRLDDLKIAAEIMEGKNVAPYVRFLVYPASKKVLQDALRLGYIEKLVMAGAQLAVPSCGPCLGAYGGILAPEENCISSANRNFKGRMGCKQDTGIYLASPATVAHSALAGHITAEA